MQKQLECKTEEDRDNKEINVILIRCYVRDQVLKYLSLVCVTDVAAQKHNISKITSKKVFFLFFLFFKHRDST